jgi:hypothetical protein
MNKELESIQHTLGIARRTLAALEDQAAGYTALTIPASLRTDIEAKRAEVAQLQARLTEDSNGLSVDSDGVLSKKVLLPVVVVTMTFEQAERLFRDRQAAGIDNILQLTSPQELVQRYNAQRDGWCPFGRSSNTIREILEEFAQKTPIPENGKTFQVEFEFHSEAFFSDNPDDRNWVADSLGENGCLFIIDGISLAHTDVRQRFQNNLIDVQGPLSFFLISSIDPRSAVINKWIEEHIDQHFWRFLREHDVKLNPLYSLFIGNQIDLRRGLKTSLKELKLTNRPMPSSWPAQFNKAGIPESGLKDYVLGRKQ